jgi:hypothetical protein
MEIKRPANRSVANDAPLDFIQGTRQQKRVRVQKQENVTGGMTRANVHLPGAPRKRLKNIWSKTLRNFDGVIQRAAIDNNQLDIGVVSKLA